VDNLNCHNCSFFKLQMNLKCKVIFNINIVKYFLNHLTIEFNGNHLKNYGCVFKKEWTFEMMTLRLLCRENENYEFKKYVIIVSKREKKGHYWMSKLRVRCIETYLIQKNSIL
jgi:hypothetical protein